MQTQAITSHIVRWMSDYLHEARSEGFVVGISGGIDSALCSTLAAMTGLPTLCVGLPIHQARSHTDRAAAHIAFLKETFPNCASLEIDLSGVYDLFAAALPPEGDPARVELARANSRSRLRMTALYYLAGLRGSLVVGTGNKIEDFGVGFFTKYGDGGVDLSPIGDLTKSEVYELAAHLGVCTPILEAPPSDGLFAEERTDEQQLGATYPELEQAMAYLLAGGRVEELVGREREVAGIYLARHRANRHKMEPVPVCIIPGNLKRE